MDGVTTFFVGTALALGTAAIVNSYFGNRRIGIIQARLSTSCCFLITQLVLPIFANNQPRRGFYDPIFFPPEDPEDVRTFMFYNQNICCPGQEHLVNKLPNGLVKMCLPNGEVLINSTQVSDSNPEGCF